MGTIRILNYKEQLGAIPYSSENTDSILFVRNPVDYQLDGFIAINRKFIEESALDKGLERNILESKTSVYIKSFNCSLIDDVNSMKSVFNFLLKQKTFCELHLSREEVLYVGEVMNVEDEGIDIDFYGVDFLLQDEAYVGFEDIRYITFYADYSQTIEKVVKANRRVENVTW